MNKSDTRIIIDKEERLNLFKSFEENIKLNPEIFLKIPYYTYKKYKYGLLSIPYDIFDLVFEKSKISQLSSKRTLSSNWGAVKGGKIGIRNLYKKYGKQKFSEWRKTAAGKNPLFKSQTKSIEIPDKDESLGEFIGITLGDGTLTKYFVRFSGDAVTDLPYFKEYIPKLILKLFKIKPSIYFDRSRICVVVCSVKLCEYLHKAWGLPFGDKILNKAQMSESILENTAMLKGCIRGLIDTDGYIGKDGDAFCIRFTSHNPLLFDQMKKAMKKFDVISFSFKTELGTRKKERILKYMSNIHSSNLKNVIRFKEYNENKRLIKIKDLDFLKYQNIKLPYKWTRGLSVKNR